MSSRWETRPALAALALAACGTIDFRFGADGATGGTATGGTATGGSSSGGAGSGGGEPSGGAPSGPTGGLASAGAATGGGAAGGEPPAGGAVTGGGGAAPTVQPLDGLVGWAAVAECGPAGTRGGADGPTVEVATRDELLAALATDEPLVIHLSDVVDLEGELLTIGSRKTLTGRGGGGLRGPVRVSQATDVVLQDLSFDGSTTTGNQDALEITEASCVWIDHVDVFDGADGNLDIVRGSTRVTVSWSRIRYVTREHDHRFACLCGASDTDTPGRLDVTFHHVWWGEGILEKMPRVRFGRVHVFNSYYSAAGNSYCIGAGYEARLLVEGNVFDGVDDPIVYQSDEEVPGSGVHTAQVVERLNDYSTATGERVSGGAAFTPPYPYVLEPASAVRAAVVADAGPR